MTDQPQDAALKDLEVALGHSFTNYDRLRAALTHPSLEHEEHYQRLEFFGDRVLGLVIAEALMENFPRAEEGELSQRLNAQVRKEALAEVALDLDLGRFIQMAPSTEKSGGRTNASILADVMEAVIAALYLDGGLDAVRTTIRNLWAGRLVEEDPGKDAKTRLQEWLQGRGEEAPKYNIADWKGPAHAPHFTIRVEAGELGGAEGRGRSRQAAEFAAAEALLRKLQSQGDEGE